MRKLTIAAKIANNTNATMTHLKVGSLIPHSLETLFGVEPLVFDRMADGVDLRPVVLSAVSGQHRYQQLHRWDIATHWFYTYY